MNNDEIEKIEERTGKKKFCPSLDKEIIDFLVS